ncbi:uncharacterized protein F4817DRAFT_369653 [Daldinia loculata]|uniref:uncharacterized protein n=1 Tax=Daldinia loculata TaxID=103429 RepID=UPI0020C310FA|nr:uncharacterized protein F4817DRAFT_369653 [Daldinia loculata]KAI1642175.1 hypothetical protein F4817DRAFT_369653 [Daldinia loculata]
MDLIEYYAIGVGAGFCLLLVGMSVVLIRALCAPAGRRLRRMLNPLLPTWACGRIIISMQEATLLCVILTINGLCVGVNVRDGVSEVAKRLGRVALVNLVPISCGAHMNYVISICGIRLDQYARLHAWLGGIVIVEVTLHTIFGRGAIHDIAGLLASCSVWIIGVVSIPIIRRWVFELFTKLHTVSAAVALFALWLHLPSSTFYTRPRLYLLLSLFIFILTKFVRLLNIIYSSVSLRGKSIALVERQGDGVEIRIRMARPLKFKAGQYIYLSLWGLSKLSALEFHPFQICWDYPDESGHQILVLLVQPRKGFTKSLLTSASYQEYLAFVEGPYGRPLSLGQYGTVLLLATGVGITGQLPYVKELLKLYLQCEVKTRRIALFWEVESEVHRYWVRKWMDELLALDRDYILDIQLYIKAHFLSSRASKGDVEKLGSHGRITLTYATMRPNIIIASEMERRKGKTLVSLCTNPSTTRVITDILEHAAHTDVDVKRLDFQPWTTKVTEVRF